MEKMENLIITQETMSKDLPQSRRKSKLFLSLVGLYNAIVGSDLYNELDEDMKGIVSEINDYQNGRWLQPKYIDPNYSKFNKVAVSLMPYHRRKRALFTNLVAFVNLAGKNEKLADFDGSENESFKTSLAEIDAIVTKNFTPKESDP